MAIIQRAIDASELRVSELAPFTLRAEVQIETSDSKPLAGRFELTWVSPTRWREEIKVGGYTQVRIGGDGEVWQFPAGLHEAGRIRGLARKLLLREALLLDTAATVSEPRKREDKGKQILCVKVKRRDVFGGEHCFDATSGLLLRTRSGGDWVEYMDYQPVGARFFPFRLVKRGKDVVRVVGLRANSQPSPELFQPPPGVIAMAGCESPTPPQVLEQENPRYPPALRGKSATVILSGLVAPNGSFGDLKLIQSGGQEGDAAALDAVRKWKFQPASCNGRPVPYPIDVEVRFDTY